MIDADPDYSADFAIALAAITTYSAVSRTHMRVVTLSGDKLHEITRDPFEYLSTPREFLIPDEHRIEFTAVEIPEEQTASEALFEFANKLDPSFPHTCFRYTEEDDSWLIKPSMQCEDTEEWLKQWNETILTPSDQHLIQDLIKPRPIDHGGNLLTLPPSFRYATQINCPGQVVVVTSNTCRRKIFDLITRQVVTVTLRTSLSERNSQVNLVHRIAAPAQSIHILMRPDYLTKCPPTMRRMRILNDQLGGFLTGLTQFNPRSQYMSVLLRLLKKYMDNHQMVVTDMMNRLVSQQLCDWASSNSMLSLKVENPKVYYTILDQVDYNHHIAYFLSIPSDDSWINMIKVKIASALASGYTDTVRLSGMATSHLANSDESWTDVDETINAFLKQDLANGIVTKFNHFGTVWASVSVIDAHVHKVVPVGMKTIPAANDYILVNMTQCTEAEESFGTLRSLLVANSITVGEPTSMRVLAKPEYLVICEHLLLAFAHQVAVVDFSTGENVFHDHLSGVKLETSLEVQILVSLETVKNYTNADRVFGVYTTLARRGDGRTTVCDWTWIPPQVWDKWSDKLELYTGRKPNDIWALRLPRYNEGETIGVQLKK
ncbi:hypothetical protein H9Q69_001331 [Fusarium xylarioides]|uniref:Uncharacterized protein n=1 Tax=Fusarium xylarioides TaxID=221167 RepID=A0A9P7HIS1_9HYPO|nr:hypothetical protein H9Q72_010425 [Fusarium xylarioides]KAG5799701.1 hypothetical protein H9Q69_001331 [Fusarium xylarioides]